VNYALCDCEGETSQHIFLFCEVSSNVWSLVMRWLDFSFITPPNLFVYLEWWSGEASNEKLWKGYWIIWHETIWLIWNARNSHIFNDTVKDME